jgi:hypothetical protein
MSEENVELLLWTFRNGEAVRWTYFGEDRAEALDAAGLSE